MPCLVSGAKASEGVGWPGMKIWKRWVAGKAEPPTSVAGPRPSGDGRGTPHDPDRLDITEAEANPFPQSVDQEEQSRDGAVWTESGRVRVRNPTGRGRWPSVIVRPELGCELYVNATPATGEVVLRAEDNVELRVPGQEEPGSIDVSISEDGLSAWVVNHPAQRTIIDVPDIEPKVQIDLIASTRTEAVRQDRSTADVMAALAKAGVQAGIDPDAVEHALRAPGEQILVARGQAAVPGQATTVWSVTEGAVKGPMPSRPSPGIPVGPRPYVETGQPVAQLTPGVAGRSGTTVTGQPLPPSPEWLPRLVAGNGVLLSADGLTAIAAVHGHPNVQIGAEEVIAAVHHEFQIPGDVQDDNVVQAGDIWVGGNVPPGRRIRATGSVEVRGHVVRARVEAGTFLRISGGAVNAVVVAGGPGLLYVRLIPLYEHIERFIAEARAGGVDAALLRGAPTMRNLEHLALQEVDEDPDGLLKALLPHLRAVMQMAGARATPERETIILDEMAETVRFGLATMRLTLARAAHCFVHHLENGRVEATGDVDVGEAGALRSHVVTLGRLRAYGPFRGGSVLAIGGATFVSVGSSSDAKTRVQVGGRAVFRATEVLPGTVVVYGSTSRQFDAPACNVVLGPAP